MLYDQFVTWDHNHTSGDGIQLYACCPIHADDTPSFTVNTQTNQWYCHGCEKGGSEKEFIMSYYEVDSKIAKTVLDNWEKRGIIIFPSNYQIDTWHQNLKASPTDLKVLHGFGITDTIIDEFKLGLEDIRIVFPIKSRTYNWVNARKYLPPHRRSPNESSPKCINIRGLGQRRYYPYEAFNQQEIWIVEGEKDCMAARSQGINAVTGTGGSAIPTEEIGLFAGKDVVLMLDTDAVGARAVKNYAGLLRNVANTVQVVKLPDKDFVAFYERTGHANVHELKETIELHQRNEIYAVAQETTLVRSEFTENLGTWVKLQGMSVIGVDPRIYSIPQTLQVACNNTKCQRPCPVMNAATPVCLKVDPRQALQFTDAADSAQDSYVRKVFGCKSAIAEGMDYMNVQKIIFQESASFMDGLEETSFEHRYGMYLYTDYRLAATLRYDFEACRVTDPKSQQNYYVIRSADCVANSMSDFNELSLDHYRETSEKSETAAELIGAYYQEWLPLLAIEERPDLFGAMLLTYCSVTEIAWQGGLLKGWLDTMVIGDTRTGKSQMAQRFVKSLGLGGYINGENARRTGVIGGVQRFGESWVVTWGAIPMNDRGMLIIDEASGLDIDDVKDLSSTRSSGAVTLNKIVKGEARARTRLLWLSNPRSGRNLAEFYWKGFGAFQEFIPVMEDQARFDLVVSAAREDVDVLNGIESDARPDLANWRALISLAWVLDPEDIIMSKELREEVRATARRLNDDLGGGALVVGVAVHEKLLRMTCAFAVLCGAVSETKLLVNEKHLRFADEFLRNALNKPSMGYGDFIREFKRAQLKRSENMDFVKALVTEHPALRALLSVNSFKGSQFQEILGMDRSEASGIMSSLITRGLLRPGTGASYVPDKLLMEIAKQMEV